jgi:hypothetical protein
MELRSEAPLPVDDEGEPVVTEDAVPQYYERGSVLRLVSDITRSVLGLLAAIAMVVIFGTSNPATFSAVCVTLGALGLTLLYARWSPFRGFRAARRFLWMMLLFVALAMLVYSLPALVAMADILMLGLGIYYVARTFCMWKCTHLSFDGDKLEIEPQLPFWTINFAKSSTVPVAQIASTVPINIWWLPNRFKIGHMGVEAQGELENAAFNHMPYVRDPSRLNRLIWDAIRRHREAPIRAAEADARRQDAQLAAQHEGNRLAALQLAATHEQNVLLRRQAG